MDVETLDIGLAKVLTEKLLHLKTPPKFMQFKGRAKGEECSSHRESSTIVFCPGFKCSSCFKSWDGKMWAGFENCWDGLNYSRYKSYG